MPDKRPVIFIDDEKHIRIANRQTLELAGYVVKDYSRAENVLADISPEWPGVIVSDIKMPGLDGLELLQKVQAIDSDLPVILITGHGDIAMAVQSIRQGAYDFIEKPFPAEQLMDSVRRAQDKRALTLENRVLRRELEAQNAPGPRIIGRTPQIKRLRQAILQLADTGADVLVVGDTGTGKELVARSLHEYSKRRDNNFVAVNCGAISDTLIESELFGHEAGAFTGAVKQRIGKFEYADGGTVFLDEIESMPLQVQIHLLRVLQERSIERLGSNSTVDLDFRVVAATKADLKESAQAGEFREDLYYRMNVVTLEIPPLRERREDIPLLFHHFLLVANARYGCEAPPPAPEQIVNLLAHQWPGNVRELRNVAERYVLLGAHCEYDLEQLLHAGPAGEKGELSLPSQVACFERSIIEQSLVHQKGCIKDVMSSLGVPRKTLYDKMKKYGLDKRRYKSGEGPD
ncbi:MAG TPA: sigma-54-dependent Fis family transcriptional regulator [Gammaproteobacteria bacterium]|nr:sigma-54-dependent Fis family transcriptional regulator [Gammaproteobacteria bacterium]